MTPPGRSAAFGLPRSAKRFSKKRRHSSSVEVVGRAGVSPVTGAVHGGRLNPRGDSANVCVIWCISPTPSAIAWWIFMYNAKRSG